MTAGTAPRRLGGYGPVRFPCEGTRRDLRLTISGRMPA